MLRKILESVWNEIVFGSHMAALVGVFIILILIVLAGKPVSFLFLLTIYMTAYIIYAYDRYKGIKEDSIDNPARSNYLQSRLLKIRIFILSYLILLILFSYYNSEKIISLYTFGLLGLGLLYTLFFKNFTKKIIAFKSLYVAGWWISLIPFYTVYHSVQWNASFTLFIIFLFLRLFVGINFFDLKDILSDGKRGLKTLGVLLGIETTEKILKIINILSAIPILLGIFWKILPLYSIALLISLPYTILYFKKLKQGNISKEFLYYVMVNAESTVWLATLFVFKKFFNIWQI